VKKAEKARKELDKARKQAEEDSAETAKLKVGVNVDTRMLFAQGVPQQPGVNALLLTRRPRPCD